MSILRDLEPQNAKIHSTTLVASKRHRIAAALTVLLLLSGTIGLFRSTQSEQTEPAMAHPATPLSIDADLAHDDSTATPTPGIGSALIRENGLAQINRESNKAHYPDALPAMQIQSGKAQDEQQLANNTSPQAGKLNLAPAEQHRKTMNNVNARKLPKNSARHLTSNDQQIAESHKRTMERDIDIIKAIVK